MSVLSKDLSSPPLATSRTRVVVNFVAFQAGWFACVLGAAHGRPAAGTLIAAILVAGHVMFSPRPAQELKLIGVALGIGLLWDSALVTLGWIDFTSGFVVAGLAPHWILALWALFAMTLNVSLGWLKKRLGVAALLGAISGPLAYWGGVRLGAVTFVNPLLAVIALSAGWAAITPALAFLARRFDGAQPQA